MRVAEYHRRGLQRRVEAAPEGFVPLGAEARDGVHRVAFYAQVADGRLARVVHTGSKRCRKLLALADWAAQRLEGQPYPGYRLSAEDLLRAFAEEKDWAKMQARAALVLRALGLTA